MTHAESFSYLMDELHPGSFEGCFPLPPLVADDVVGFTESRRLRGDAKLAPARMPIDPRLEPFNALVGTWEIQATHPMFPSTIVRGTASFEWLEGERFLLQRSLTDHREFPDSLIVFGADDEGLSMNYFDSRGVHRIYNVSFSDDIWRMWRHSPGFSQKFNGRLSADGNTIDGLWKLSRDDSTWDDDLAITFRRARSPTLP